MDSFAKPITIKQQEFIKQITDVINNSGLPYFVVEYALTNMLYDVNAMAKKQYERDMARYEEMKKVMNKKAVTDCVQDDGEEVQVSQAKNR